MSRTKSPEPEDCGCQGGHCAEEGGCPRWSGNQPVEVEKPAPQAEPDAPVPVDAATAASAHLCDIEDRVLVAATNTAQGQLMLAAVREAFHLGEQAVQPEPAPLAAVARKELVRALLKAESSAHFARKAADSADDAYCALVAFHNRLRGEDE